MGAGWLSKKRNIDWQARLSLLLDDVEVYRNNRGYDCIIGVSGVKIAIIRFIL